MFESQLSAVFENKWWLVSQLCPFASLVASNLYTWGSALHSSFAESFDFIFGTVSVAAVPTVYMDSPIPFSHISAILYLNGGDFEGGRFFFAHSPKDLSPQVSSVQ